MFNSPLLGYIGFGLAVLAMACGVVFPDYAQYLWMVASLLGYGSVSVVRATIDSKGWKTHSIFATVVVLTVLQLTNVITPEVYNSLMIAFSPVTGITVTTALVTADAIPPMLKKAA